MISFSNRSVCAVVVAAGNSTRMGGTINKQLLPLCGKPVIAHTLQAFDHARKVDEIVVVCRVQEKPAMQLVIQDYGIQKVKALVEGGATRQQSVWRGVQASYPDIGYLAIHDGARALIRPVEIDRVIEDAFQWGCSTLAVPVKNTIKIANQRGWVIETPNRSSLWSIQTPQVFEKIGYQQAMQQARKEGADYTDDCQLMEHCGRNVHLCMGSYENNKITTADDLAVAEIILQKREESK